ncbi:anaerobic ribonucleoside-triphosphate reductase, partial [Oxalobacter sp. OttesenSCG-928-P03]|nr:anaerobic ribonucleoside-triphosphate reductase [Oxalobacter sp. OttesenSCG-928-P03]
WSDSKVRVAVSKSANRAGAILDEIDYGRIIGSVRADIATKVGDDTEVPVTTIHEVVEKVLNCLYPKVGQSYSNYRSYIMNMGETWDKVYQKTKETLYLGDRENANFNSALISTKGSIVKGHLMKEVCQKFYLSPDELQATEDGYLYAHDMRDLPFNGINCCLFDMGTVLQGGFEMSGVKYKEPKSVLSALQVIGDVTLVATAQQFGGFTIPEFDKVLLPYVKKTRARFFEEATQYKVLEKERYVTEKTTEEIRQGIQSFEMKLNTVPSSRGDTAFVTISFGNCDIPEDADIQRLICECILDTRMNGQGNGAPVVFPKLVYLHSEKQHEEAGQQKLFDKAIECNSKAMYPDYLSLDNEYVSEVGRIYHTTGKVVSPMGCRAYLSDYKDENGESYFVGRANIGAVSLNLPMIWKKSDGASFMSDLKDYLDIARGFLKKRYEAVAGNLCSTNPLAFTQGGIRGGFKKPEDKVGMDIVKSFTASFGITALNELNVLAEGKELHESDQRFVTEVVNVIYGIVDRFKQEDGYLYALYATPAESLAGTQVEQFRKKFGEIPKVSDKAYFSNGFHCAVTAPITPFQKQDMEYNLYHFINGGHIQYVRLDSATNKEAIKTLVKRGMRMGFYQGVNFDLVVCNDCGYRPRSFNEVCPLCESRNIMHTARVCGYLGIKYSNGNTRFNDAKIAECNERVSM